jgi:uncharacterized protein YbbC (DUF1343 family)
VSSPIVRTGLDVVRDRNYDLLRGCKIGIVAHAASVAANLDHITKIFEQADLDVRVLFGPEHGLGGTAQDMEAVGDGRIQGKQKIPVISLYGDSPDKLKPNQDSLSDIDVLVVDLQDIGTRYYTYVATLKYCMQACAAAGVRVVVLDRPNPLNGVDFEGHRLEPGYYSFVGEYDVPVRHGLTIGELARLGQSQETDLDLNVVKMQGWQRDMWFDQTGLPWVMPSPNMPTLDTAIVYPGCCLVEATNLSEARGTTRPFELIGAPWINGNMLADQMNRGLSEGVVFRPVEFIPTFQKHAGEACSGVQFHITNRSVFKPYSVGLRLLFEVKKQIPEMFAWRAEAYEFVTDRPAIDLLTGSDEVRIALDANLDFEEYRLNWGLVEQEYDLSRKDILLY